MLLDIRIYGHLFVNEVDPSIDTVETGSDRQSPGEMVPLIHKAVQHPNYRKTVISNYSISKHDHLFYHIGYISFAT